MGDSAATANQKIVNAGLIMGVSGATNASSSTVRAISQSIAAGTEVEAGTVVRVQFSDSGARLKTARPNSERNFSNAVI